MMNNPNHNDQSTTTKHTPYMLHKNTQTQKLTVRSVPSVSLFQRTATVTAFSQVSDGSAPSGSFVSTVCADERPSLCFVRLVSLTGVSLRLTDRGQEGRKERKFCRSLDDGRESLYREVNSDRTLPFVVVVVCVCCQVSGPWPGLVTPESIQVR